MRRDITPDGPSPGVVWIRPILVDRPTAGLMLGVSEAKIRDEQRAGRLRAKTTHIQASSGRVTGKALYLVSELERWAQSLDDA